MKKLTLDETWEQCLKMWRWIVRQPCPRDIDLLKLKYLEKNGFCDDELDNNCYLCEYDKQQNHPKAPDCSKCPARRIEKHFHCGSGAHYYAYKPAAFLRKLNELNKKRLAKRSKR